VTFALLLRRICRKASDPCGGVRRKGYDYGFIGACGKINRDCPAFWAMCPSTTILKEWASLPPCTVFDVNL